MNKNPELQPEKSIVSLEICEESIKLCETAFFKREKPVIRLAAKKVSWRNSNIAEEITVLFRTHGFKAKKVLINIPRYLVMARVLRLPSVNDDEIASIVKTEAVKQMPYRDEGIITGYKIIEKLKDGYSDVLLIISQAGTISRFIDILRNAKLIVEKIALSSESLFNWYSMIKEKSKEEAQNVALINLNAEYVDMDVIETGRLVFTRAFSYGLNEPDATRKVIEEIKKSIDTYQKERERNVNKIFLSGAGDKIRMVQSTLTQEIETPLEAISQTEAIELAENADMVLRESSFVGLIGLSLRPRDIEINLLPREMAEDKEFHLFKKALTKTLILISCVALLSLGVIGQKIFNKYWIFRLLNSEIEAMAPRVEKAKRMREDMKIIRNEIEKRPLAIDILSEIYKITPRGAAFNLVDYTSDKAMVVRGSAPSLGSIIKFITTLEDSEYFENVKLKYTAKRSGKRKKTDFEIVSFLSKVK